MTIQSSKIKLLILGGKPIGACEIVQRAKELGLYTIVTDYLPFEQSPAKKISDEYWQISTSNIDILREKCIENNIKGVISAVHEFNIGMAIKLNEILNLPNICDYAAWIKFINKKSFKNLCLKNGLDIAKEYNINDKANIKFPVITKPVDGSGSRGFSICHNFDDLKTGYEKALNFSSSKEVLIEQYIPYDSVIIHYTINDGEIFFSGMSDKKSLQLKQNGGSVMALQIFPSEYTSNYLNKCDVKIKNLIKMAGIKNGVLWIEAFTNGENFIFNEIGYRFGGSLTYYPVKYFTGINQLDMLINYSISRKTIISKPDNKNKDKKYSIIPLHLKPGKIKKIIGIDKIKQHNNLYAYVPVHFENDLIENWASAQQVFCYIHILFDTYSELQKTLFFILENLHVSDENNNELLFCLYDFKNLKGSDYE